MFVTSGLLCLAAAASLGAGQVPFHGVLELPPLTFSWSAAAGVVQTVFDRTKGSVSPRSEAILETASIRAAAAGDNDPSGATLHRPILIAQATVPQAPERHRIYEDPEAIISSVDAPLNVVSRDQTPTGVDALDNAALRSKPAQAEIPRLNLQLAPVPAVELDRDLLAKPAEPAAEPPATPAPAIAQLREVATVDAQAPARNVDVTPPGIGTPRQSAPDLSAERMAEMAAAHAQEALAQERKAALERERERADALARELARLREELGSLRTATVPSLTNAPVPPLILERTSEAQQASPPAAADPAPQRQNAAPAGAAPAARAVDPPQAPQSRLSEASEKRLLDRAETLLKGRDISAARLILERGVSEGSERALFLLAQTYDPVVLNRWQVLGVMGDPAKARELYARASAAGLAEAGQRGQDLTAR